MDAVFYILLLKYNIIKREKAKKSQLEQEFELENSKIYKIDTI